MPCHKLQGEETSQFSGRDRILQINMLGISFSRVKMHNYFLEKVIFTLIPSNYHIKMLPAPIGYDWWRRPKFMYAVIYMIYCMLWNIFRYVMRYNIIYIKMYRQTFQFPIEKSQFWKIIFNLYWNLYANKNFILFGLNCFRNKN